MAAFLCKGRGFQREEGVTHARGHLAMGLAAAVLTAYLGLTTRIMEICCPC